MITPEYNASIPAVVKNATDWLSRPYGEGAVTAKPLAVIGASGGRYGGVWAHDETRKSFGGAGAPVPVNVSAGPRWSNPVESGRYGSFT